jgi:hypothetical protein
MHASCSSFLLLATTREVVGMAALAVLTFLVVMGALSPLYGVDSRLLGDRGWYGSPRR